MGSCKQNMAGAAANTLDTRSFILVPIKKIIDLRLNDQERR